METKSTVTGPTQYIFIIAGQNPHNITNHLTLCLDWIKEREFS